MPILAALIDKEEICHQNIQHNNFLSNFVK